MKTLHPSMLAAKVAGRNLVHALARNNVPAMLAALTPFIGAKVVLQSGKFTKELIEVLPKGEWTYRDNGHALVVDFKACENGLQYHSGESCTYQECTVYLGELGHKGTHLQKVYDFDPQDYRIDFSVQEIEAARGEAKALEKELNRAKSKFHLFGEHDNF